MNDHVEVGNNALEYDQRSMRRDRPYNGQAHTDTGIRGATEVKGITFRDVRDCFIRAVLQSTGAGVLDGVDMNSRYNEACKGENALLDENDLYGFNSNLISLGAVQKNLACEIERVMGIYPNIPPIIGKTLADAALEGIVTIEK